VLGGAAALGGIVGNHPDFEFGAAHAGTSVAGRARGAAGRAPGRAATGSALADLEQLGHFAVAKALDVMEQEDQAGARRQLGDRALEVHPLGAQGTRTGRRQVVRQGLLAPAPVVAKAVEAAIGQRAMQPGRGRVLADLRRIRPGPVQSEEGVLDGVLGVLPVLQHAPCGAVHSSSQETVELRNRVSFGSLMRRRWASPPD
jgi:hypothetical protein